MKWLDITSEQPQTRMIGLYNSESDLPRIAIYLCLSNTRCGTLAVATAANTSNSPMIFKIFTKNPALLRYEDPNADDVYEKYKHIVAKIIKIIEGSNYNQLVGWLADHHLPISKTEKDLIMTILDY